MLANASSSGISWAYIIKLQGGYFGKNRIYDRKTSLSVRKKIVSVNFLIARHNVMLENWC